MLCYGVSMRVPEKNEILLARRDAGLTQVQAGELIGIKAEHWSRLENGHCLMPAHKWDYFLIKLKARRLSDTLPVQDQQQQAAQDQQIEPPQPEQHPQS